MAVKLKNLLCIALAMVCLASCGRDVTGGADTQSPRKTEAPEIAPARDLVEDTTEDAGWSALRLTEDDGKAAVAQEGIYLLHVWDLRLLSRDGESDELICTLPEDSDMNARAICSDGSGVYLALYFAQEERCEIRFYSKGGDERAVTELGTGGLSPYDLCCDGERLYLRLANFYGDAKLLVLSRDGEQEYELEIPGIYSPTCGGGNVYVCSGKPAEIYRVDNEARELVKLTALSDGRMVGAGEEVIYISDETSVYEIDVQTLETRRLLDWASCGVSGTGRGIFPDGENFVVTDISGVLYLTPREGPARRRVVLGVNSSAAFIPSREVVAFNMANDEYELVVRDYGVYEQPQAILGAEMAAGAGPDLIDASAFSPDLLRAGVMVDLMTLLESDGGIGPDDLLAGPLRAMQTEKGELFAIAPTFHVETIVRHADGAGTLVKGMREFVSAAVSLEALGDPETAFAGTFCREDFLSWAFCLGDGALYSEEDVRAILEYAAALPLRENKNWLGLGSAVPLLFSSAVNLFTASQDYLGDTELDNLEVFGVPFCEGTGLINPAIYLAIPCGSAEVQGAWEYIKFVMRDVDTFDLPLYKPAYLENKAEIERYAKQGKLLISYDIYGDYAWIESESRDLAFSELFELVLDGLGGVYYPVDDTLLDLVNRGAAAYFAGEGTADEAARAVCSRLELYLGERYG